MANAKRKNVLSSDQKSGSSPKRSKNVENAESTPKKSRFTDEAETDSDPIVESDTGSESGEDDGASWPSGNEQGDMGDVPVGAYKDAGTVGIAADAADAKHPMRKNLNSSGRFRRRIRKRLKLMSS